MKILVVGAGALGSLYAARLHRAGHAVTVLARGQRLAALQAHGLVLQDLVTGAQFTEMAPVIDTLAPDDPYDLALVVMGYHQVAGVLPVLAANRCIPSVLFMGNNVAGPDELVYALGVDRVLQGFPLASGTIHDGIVYYAAETGRRKSRVVLGELDGSTTLRLTEIARAFESAGFRAEISPKIDAWLKTHAAIILPLAAAHYASGMDPQRMAHTQDALVLMLRAVREGLRVIRASGRPILPSSANFLFEFVPEPIQVLILSQLMQNNTFQLALVHADKVRPELRELAVHFMVMAAGTQVPTRALNCTCTMLDPAFSPLSKGSHAIPLDWRRLAGLVLLVLGIVVGVKWIKKS